MDEQKETERDQQTSSLFVQRVLADYKARRIAEQKILDTYTLKKEPKPRGSI